MISGKRLSRQAMPAVPEPHCMPIVPLEKQSF
jgi:hypothetical protein